MIIERIPEMALGHGDDRAIARLLRDCFDTDFKGHSYFVNRHHLRLIVRDQGRVIGHLALMLRAIDLGDERVDIIGVAEVATDAQNRGRGIAGRLLRAAIGEARQSPAAYMCLFGTAGIYAAAGFQHAPNPLRYSSDDGAGQSQVDRCEEFMVLPICDRPWDPILPVDLRGPKF